MPYTNPLHPPVFSTQSTSFNSIGMAITTPPHPCQFISSARQLLPQECKTSTRSPKPAPVIPFDYIGFQNQGVPMRELSSRGIFALGSMIVSANEQIFVRSNLKSIVLRIVWPGYEHINFACAIELIVFGKPITRAQFGARVADIYAQFLQHAVRGAVCAVPHYQCGGTSGILLQNLVLLGVRHIAGDIWQADVAIDR